MQCSFLALHVHGGTVEVCTQVYVTLQEFYSVAFVTVTVIMIRLGHCSLLLANDLC